MGKKKYVVGFNVWERIEQEIECDENLSDYDKLQLAVEKASDEKPKVFWTLEDEPNEEIMENE